MLTISKLIGEWRLKEFTIEKKDFAKKAWGRNSHGILMYSLHGYMSVSINSDPDDLQLVSNQNILFYAGKYDIIDGNKIAHHVMNATDATRIGQTLTRDASIENNTLHLIARGKYGEAILTWEKIAV